MSLHSLTRRGLAARLLPLLDLTSLGEDDSPERIELLCASARTPHGSPAAVCVYPEHVTIVRRAVGGTGMRVATVVNFPDGGHDHQRVACETRRAIAAGADEIDLVFPYRAFLQGDVDAAERVVSGCREVCGERALLKLILETGELEQLKLIRDASRLGIRAGVDFLKTSTGKVAVNATLRAAQAMLEVISDTGGHCGFKAAGGIRTLDDAAAYLELVRSCLGEAWIDARRFRIGASALFAELRAVLAESA